MDHALATLRLSAFAVVLCQLGAAVANEPADLLVAADGSGDFTSIQAALDSIPVGNDRRVLIHIAPGQYNERVRVDHSFVTLRGSGPDETKLRYFFPREDYHRRYDRFGPAVLNVFGEDVIVQQMTIENTQTETDVHAFAIYGQPQRFILDSCHVLSEGGDTVSLWNTSYGMYYHRNCLFRGGVDFVCPRGWCYVSDSRFESINGSAAIWQDGHMDLDMKFVLRNCEFAGPEDFSLGRNHYPSQFYLLDCRFDESMADKPIEVVSQPKQYYAPEVYQRKYFSNCHREGGDYAWHADNLQTAPGTPSADQITPAWTFDGQWDPQRSDSPTVAAVESEGDEVHVYFSEPVACKDTISVVREDGTLAPLFRGMGTSHLVFKGGTASSAAARLQTSGAAIHAVTATLTPRYVEATDLPESSPRQHHKVLLIGDSTVATYEANNTSQGWGASLSQMFDDRVEVLNHARGGRSSKSFRDEGLWDVALATEPDFVFIQFGHNDNPGKGPERYTDPAEGGEYRANLRRYVREAREAGAVAILVSPPTRRRYLPEGQIDPQEGNTPYAEAAKAVALETDCAFVDLNAETRQLFNRLEESHSQWIQPLGDRTHFTPRGSRRIAQIVAAGIQHQVEPLGRFLIREQLARP